MCSQRKRETLCMCRCPVYGETRASQWYRKRLVSAGSSEADVLPPFQPVALADRTIKRTPSPVQRRVKKRKAPGLQLESWALPFTAHIPAYVRVSAEGIAPACHLATVGTSLAHLG